MQTTLDGETEATERSARFLVSRWRPVAVVFFLALWATGTASAYPWPVKPFNAPHAIRGAFDDPRFHLGAEGSLSAFHFGIDIVARDGTPVYSVSPGFVRRRAGEVTVRRPASGRVFGYWHIRPVVRTGRHVRVHQLLGYVLPGWGHVHFAESVNEEYRNPLRRGAIAPFEDHTKPTVASVGFLASSTGGQVDTGAIHGVVDIQSEVYDTPPLRPRGSWSVARLAPAYIWWKLWQGENAVTDWNLAVDFGFALMPGSIYSQVYAPGTYQNKANRPGRYLFWLTREFDTTTLPDGRYRITVLAEDTRFNSGTASLEFTIANGAPQTGSVLSAGMLMRRARAY